VLGTGVEHRGYGAEMSIGILGKKVGMTRLFGENGEVIPVTVIEAGPCHIVQVKNKETDGYEAVQVGFKQKRENLVNRPVQGHFRRANVPPLRFLREFRPDSVENYQMGDQLNVDIFSAGELVDVSGISKGKGFSGVVKRWHFKGGKASHGAETHRAGGSIGASATPSRVFKGFPMAGRMGGKRVTVQNLEVVKVDTEKNVLLVKGSVPGPTNGMLMIRKAVKA
jgi:large subunit ribosomal protein L3